MFVEFVFILKGDIPYNQMHFINFLNIFISARSKTDIAMFLIHKIESVRLAVRVAIVAKRSAYFRIYHMFYKPE